MLTCTRMRTAVLLSALLMVLGVVLETFAQTRLVAVPASQFALLLVLAAAVVLGLTFLASLLPGTSQRLRDCRH